MCGLIGGGSTFVSCEEHRVSEYEEGSVVPEGSVTRLSSDSRGVPGFVRDPEVSVRVSTRSGYWTWSGPPRDDVRWDLVISETKGVPTHNPLKSGEPPSRTFPSSSSV